MLLEDKEGGEGKKGGGGEEEEEQEEGRLGKDRDREEKGEERQINICLGKTRMEGKEREGRKDREKKIERGEER